MTIENGPKRVDFHVHIDPRGNEEGVMERAREILKRAREQKVVAIGLVARGEFVEPMGRIIEEGKRCYEVDVIPGVEYSSKVYIGPERKQVGLICLGFDYNDEAVRKLFGKEENIERNALIARMQKNKLEELGFKFSGLSESDQELMEELLSGVTTEKLINFLEIAIRNEDNNELVGELLNEDRDLYERVGLECGDQDYYSDSNYPERVKARYLYKHLFAYGKRSYIDVALDVGVVIEAVHSAGGVVLYSPEGHYDQEVWEELSRIGLDGIMAWHGGRLGADGSNSGVVDVPIEVVKDLVKEGRLVLGGSDYQGKDWNIGEGNGGMFMSTRRYEDLKKYIRHKNKGRLPWKKD